MGDEEKEATEVAEKDAPETAEEETAPKEASEDAGTEETVETGEESETDQAGVVGEEGAEDGAGTVDESAEDADEPTEAEIRQAEFQAISSAETIAAVDSMSLLLDVMVPVTVDLGRTEMTINEIMKLGPGAVVKLDQPIGEPVEIRVNGELVGRGEVVVVDDQMGVQLTELCKPKKTSESQGE